MNDHRRPDFRLRSAVQRMAPIANGLLLLAFVAWMLCSNASRDGITELESLKSSAQTSESENGDGQLLAISAVGLVVGTFLTMLVGLWLGGRESRSIRAWLVFSFLVCGWLAAWLGRHDLYWYGHAIRVSGEVSAATQLANALDTNWPTGDGDYPELGVVLGYPKQNPVTLILAGEPVLVGKLRIVAVEKSKDGETLRFQLANPNQDTWLMRSKEGKNLAEFVNGFDSRYTAMRVRVLSRDWWLIRYDT